MQESQSSAFSFTTGFLLGQTSLALLIFAFIKFFIFGEPPSSSTSNRRHHRTRSYSSPHNPIALSTSFTLDRPKHPVAGASSSNSVLRPTAPLTTDAVLAKTYYNVSNHQPESVDWFNVLIAQTIAQLRVDASQDAVIVSALTNAINGSRKPDWLDDISVTEISLGEEFPIFSNCRVIPVPANAGVGADGRPGSRASGDGTRLQARMDVDLSDALTLGIETKLVLNYPRPRVAVMPVALAVSVVRFSGTLSISFIPSPATSPPPTSSAQASTTHAYTKTPQQTHPQTDAADDKPATPPTTLTFSFSPSYRLELSTHTLLGSRARLQDVPKIGQLVEAQLHKWFDERCVSPRFQQVVLPSLWPRARNTRGGDVGTEGEEKGEAGKGGLGRDMSDIDGKDEVAVDEDANGAAVEALAMPRMRKKGSNARKKVSVEHPSSGFQIPGGLPDG